MRGEPDDSTDEEDAGMRKKKSRSEVGGDDLEDDFEQDEDDWAGLGAGLGAVNKDNDEDDDEGSEDEDGVSDGDEEELEEEGSEQALDDEEPSKSEVAASTKSPSNYTKQSASKPKPELKSGGLPYTFPCPRDHDEFLETVEGIKDEDIPVVVKRIRALYHPGLAVENKTKLQVSN